MIVGQGFLPNSGIEAKTLRKCVMIRKHKQIKSKTGVLSNQPKKMTRTNSFRDRYETHFTIWPLMGSLVESAHRFHRCGAAESLQALRHFLPRSSPRLPEVADFEARELWNSGDSLMMRYEEKSHAAIILSSFFFWVVKQGERAVWKKSSSCPFFWVT